MRLNSYKNPKILWQTMSALGGTAVAKLAHAGPNISKLGDAKSESQCVTIVDVAWRSFTVTGGCGYNGHLVGRTTSMDFVCHVLRDVIASNSSTLTTESQYFRVSLASSAYRKAVEYIAAPGLTQTGFSWGTFADRKAVVEAMTKFMMGERATGVVTSHYNTKEQANACHTLEHTYNIISGTEVCTFVVWYKVLRNYMLYVLGLIDAPGAGNGVANWVAAPIQPIVYTTAARSLNEYIDRAGEINSGQLFVVEIDATEIDLLPALTYLLGGTNCLHFNWGSSGGNERVPHLAAKAPVSFNYMIIERDNLAAPAVNMPVINYPGLQAGAAGGAQALLTRFGQSQIESALAVLARSAPCRSDISAAALKVVVDMRAEPFRGVADTVNNTCGRSDTLGGWNANLDVGRVTVPSGSFACCMATRMTEDSACTMIAKQTVQSVAVLLRDVSTANALADMYVLALQHATRAVGLDAAISFPNMQVSRAEVPALPSDCVTARNALSALTGCTRRNPSELNIVTSMMCEMLYGGTLPETARYLAYGAFNEVEGCPLLNEAALGECLTSVHPAQLPSSVFTKAAIGMAGFPNRSDVIAKEMTILNTGSVYTVIGKSGSTLSAAGAATLNPGVHMLGHAVILTRDSGLNDGDVFQVQVSALPRADVATVSAVGHSFTFPKHLAFTSNPNFTGGGVERRAMTLFTDFDYRRLADLRLAVPLTARGATVVSNAEARSRVPGFVAAQIVDSFATLAGNAGVVLVQRSRKRSVEDGASAGNDGERGGGDGRWRGTATAVTTKAATTLPSGDVTDEASVRAEGDGEH